MPKLLAIATLLFLATPAAAQVTYITSSTPGIGTLASPCTATFPAGTTPGQTALFIVDGSPSVSGGYKPTAGTWSTVSDDSEPSIYSHVITGSELSTYTTSANGNVLICTIAVYSPVGSVRTLGRDSGTSTSAVGSSLNAVSGDMLLFIPQTTNSPQAASVTGTPAGMNERQLVAHQGNGFSMGLFDESISSTGATGTQSSTLSGTADWASLNLVLEPPSPTPTPTGTATPTSTATATLSATPTATATIRPDGCGRPHGRSVIHACQKGF